MPTTSSFHEVACVFLSSFLGLLIVAPIAASLAQTGSILLALGLLLLGAIIGFNIGRRRRHSRPFLYFCMIAILILAIVISSSSR